MTEPNDTSAIAERIASSIREQIDDGGSSRRRFLGRTALVGGTLLSLGGGAGFAFAEEHEDDGATVADMKAMFDDVDGTDLDVLNYALTLEKLEADFYRQGFEMFGEADFEEAAAFEGVDAEQRQAAIDTLQSNGDHESAHVEVLTQAVDLLGGGSSMEPPTGTETVTPTGNETATPTGNGTETTTGNEIDMPAGDGTTPSMDLTFDFGVETVDEMLAVGQVLENTGVAAYAGAAPFIESPDLLGVALSIHSVEARHAAYLNHLNGDSPAPDAFDEALAQDAVIDAISQFIVQGPGTGGNETDTPMGNVTEPPAGNETGAPAGNETELPAGNETEPTSGNQTDAS